MVHADKAIHAIKAVVFQATPPKCACCSSHAAFDKDDLLYLRDKEQEQRYQEQHTRDAEAAAFAAARAQAEQQLERQAVTKLRQQDMTLQDGARWAGLSCQQLL